MILMRFYIIFFIGSCIAVSCNSEYSSKKAGYYNLDFPAHAYKDFTQASFPYTFSYPIYGDIVRDSTYFDQGDEDAYWINIDFPAYNARIFLSYKRIGGKALYKVQQPDGTYRDSLGTNYFDNLVSDAFQLTAKNEVVASSRTDSVFTTANGISGVYFKVGGNAATARQFFLTDTTKNFLRGALYFSATPNADSLKPAVQFFEKDLQHFINTFQWKDIGVSN